MWMAISQGKRLTELEIPHAIEQRNTHTQKFSFQMTVIGNGEGTLSRMSSQLSLPTVPEDQQASLPHSFPDASLASTPPTPQHDTGTLTHNSCPSYR